MVRLDKDELNKMDFAMLEINNDYFNKLILHTFDQIHKCEAELWDAYRDYIKDPTATKYIAIMEEVARRMAAYINEFTTYKCYVVAIQEEVLARTRKEKEDG